MADGGASVDQEIEGATLSLSSTLEAKQKLEIKELRLKVQSLRKTITKGDKKRRREVNEDVARMEKEMEERHAREQHELEERMKNEKTGGSKPVSEVDHLVVSTFSELSVQESKEQPKLSKAQKRRERREREEKEREERIQRAEAEAGPGMREVEQERLTSQLVPLGMEIKDIPPDGHCLYAAVSDQLRVRCGLEVSIDKLRSGCAEHMRSRASEYFSFAVDHDTGKPCTEEMFEKYCDEVAHTAVWGGQLEIQALSRVYAVAVSVHQAGQAVLCIGKENQREGELHVAYHRHAYSLGEHYNSVVPKK